MTSTGILEVLSRATDPDEFVRAAMDWHFDPDTGSAFWLARAASLPFDPRTDIRGWADLALFPNMANELREVPVAELIPRGYGAEPDIVGVFDSGGTTGAPKRVPMLRDWWRESIRRHSDQLDLRGAPRGVDWLTLAPSGPHAIGSFVPAVARLRGGVAFQIDLDPRWVKKLVLRGETAQLAGYLDHVLEQAEFVLRSQRIGVLMLTPPLLERIAARPDLVQLINDSVRAIVWGGARMDADTRYLYRTEIFPEVLLHGVYGSTMILGQAEERAGSAVTDPCIFDAPAPWVSFGVVDPASGRPVDMGDRGQVVMHHLSRAFLMPNNLERDLATRVPAPAGAPGDSVADVGPVDTFDNQPVIEGVY